MIRLKIKDIAEAKGYNMSSLSRAADISFNTVKRIWRNPYLEVSTTTLERIARALEVPTGDLIEDVPDENKNKEANA